MSPVRGGPEDVSPPGFLLPCSRIDGQGQEATMVGGEIALVTVTGVAMMAGLALFLLTG